MEISRILRVIITLILVVTFIAITIGAYRQNRDISNMAHLSDSASSIVTRLSTRDLAWIDNEEFCYPYIVNSERLKEIKYNQIIGRENFSYQVSLKYRRNEIEHIIGPFGENTFENSMTCSLSVPVVLFENRIPARMKVTVWSV